MNRNMAIGVGVVIACGGVAAVALRGSTASTLSFGDVMKSKERCDVYGRLDKASIQPIKGGNLVKFAILDEHSSQRMEVLYANDIISLPANFPSAMQCRVSGVYDQTSNRFVAESVMTKCPSKYQDNGGPNPDEQKLLEKWQRETNQQSASR